MAQWLLIQDCDACGASRCAHYTDDESGEVSRLCGSDLGEVVAAYLECALWSSTDNSDDSGGGPLDANYDESDVSDDAWLSAVRDCADFLEAQAEDIDGDSPSEALSNEQVGHDFWLTRSGHGAGFWDRGLGARGERLSKACKPYGSVDLYVGDDGKIHGF